MIPVAWQQHSDCMQVTTANLDRADIVWQLGRACLTGAGIADRAFEAELSTCASLSMSALAMSSVVSMGAMQAANKLAEGAAADDCKMS